MASRDANAICEAGGKPYWVARYKLNSSRYCSRVCKAARSGHVPRERLAALYNEEHCSMQQIAEALGCSVHKVAYWMDRYGNARRTWSEASSAKQNPSGDPFTIRLPETTADHELFALAIGLYMGEGRKKGIHRVEMANSNPEILRIFLLFLEQFCNISRNVVAAQLNIFDDRDVEEAKQWWCEQLKISSE